MDKEEFYEFIHENFSLDGAALRLIQNILDYIETASGDESDQYLLACDLLSGIGLSDAELRQIAF